MNDEYYRQQPATLASDEWHALCRLLMEQGIAYDGLLPRNTIITPERLVLIDWEGARFTGRPTPPDRLTRTSRHISWSYLYGPETVAKLQSDLPFDDTAEPEQIGYEKLVASFIRPADSAQQLRERVCATATAAEADRGYPPLPYKLDDAFHIISELVPGDVEVLMDLLLAARDDASHHAAAQLIAATAKALHQAGREGYSEPTIALFKRRCAKLAWLLIDTDKTLALTSDTALLPLIDAIIPPAEERELAEQIRTALAEAYPGGQPQATALTTVARNIRHLAA